MSITTTLKISGFHSLTMKIQGFIVESRYTGKEEMALALYCNKYKLPFLKVSYSKKSTPIIPDWYVPCGTIPWITQIVGKITPNYYPEYLHDYLNRRVWQTNDWPLGQKVFIKPADVHKRFIGFITCGTYRKKKRGPYWCSEVVHFENEWRYYIANGKVMTAEWYSGDEINTPDAPPVDHIKFPTDCFAAIDFGMVNGKLTLVEAHEPFSCGWYGNDHDKYTEWLAEGWFNRDKWIK